jgi:hypothetical protein
MVQKTIEHGARNISFSADESKPLTEEDEQLIAAYVKLHDRELLLKAQGKELRDYCSSLNKQTEEVRTVLTDLKDMLVALSKQADGFVTVDPNREMKAKQIIQETERVNTNMQNYHPLLTELDLVAKDCTEKNSAFIDEVESYDLWETYDNIHSSHFANHTVNSIDIVSFDNDDELFRAFVSICDNENKAAIDYANNAIDNYSKLVLQTEMQYGIWEEFLKRLALIRMVVESKAGEIFTSSN